MTPRQGVLAAGLLLTAGLLLFGPGFGPGSGDAEPALPVAREAKRSNAPMAVPTIAPPAAPTAVPAVTAAIGKPPPRQAETPILALLARRPASLAAASAQAELFAPHAWTAPPTPQAVAMAPAASAAPAAPALPFSYLGRQSQGNQWAVFLAEGEKVLVVQAHGLIDSRYRVDAISPTAVSFTYLPLNLTQQLLIGASD